MRWLAGWVMLVWVVSRRPENGRTAQVDETVKQEPVTALQPETAGAHAPTRSGPISAIVAAFHFLVHPRTRERVATGASAETGQASRPQRDRDAYRSPMEAGITGGFSLLMGNPKSSKRR
jgi:hypothetical protein